MPKLRMYTHTEISGNLGLLATCLAFHYLHPKMASQLSRWGYSSGLQHHLQFAFWWTPLGSPQTKASSSANDKIILLIRSSDAHVLQKYSTVLECLRNPSEWKWTDMKTSTVRNKFLPGKSGLRPVPKDRVPKPRMVPALLHKERRHGSHGSFVRVMCPWMWHFSYFSQ